MSYIRNNIAVLAIFALVASFAWVYGSTRAELLPYFVPCLWVIMAEVALCFPQRRQDENSYTARERVWHDLPRDPLFWVSLTFMGLLCVPFFNIGLCPNCDADLLAQGFSADPPFKLLPFCVNRIQHLNVVLWFGPILTMALAIKHSLNKSGKINLVSLVVWNGVALAILGYVQQFFESPGPLWSDIHAPSVDSYFSTFGYPNMAGDLFTSLFCMAVALWRSQVTACNVELASSTVRRVARHKLFWLKHHDLIAVGFCFFAAMSTLSRASIILVSCSAALLAVHTGICFLFKMKKAARVKALAVIGGVLVFIAFVVTNFMPSNVQREIDTLSTDAVLTRVTGKGQYHTRVATEIWKDHPLFGCGGWGYKHFCLFKMTEDELKHLQTVGGINVHNDYLQFMAEHGSVGLALLVIVVIIILWPVGQTWRQMASAVQFDKHKKYPQPVNFFVCPAATVALLLAAVCTCIHSFGDCAMRSPAVLSTFFVCIGCAEGFMPTLASESDDKDK